MKIRPAAWITRHRKVLTLRYIYPGGSLFALPGGGLEAEESLEEALRRELQEELTLAVEPEALLWMGESPSDAHLPATLHILFQCADSGGEPQLQTQHTKALDAVWLPLDDIQGKTLYPAVGPWCAHFATQRVAYAGVLPPRPWL